MVAQYKRARESIELAADALLALSGIESPTQKQRVGALIEAEYKLTMIHRGR